MSTVERHAWDEPADFDEAKWRAEQPPEFLARYDAYNRRNAEWLDSICGQSGHTREQWSALTLDTRYDLMGKYLSKTVH